MSDNETQNVGLNLDGSFAAEAQKAAQAGEQLDKALAKVEKAKIDAAAAAMKRLRTESDAAAAAMRKAAKGTGGFGGSTPTSLLGSPAAASGFQRIVQSVGKLFGDQAAGGLVRGASWLAEASDKIGPWMPLLESGGTMLLGAGGAVAKGGEVVLKAAAALAAAGVGLAAAGVKFGIDKTAERNAANSALEKLGMNGGYEVAVDLSAKYHLDPADAVTQIKKLLNAGFSKTEIPTLIRIKAGMETSGLDGDALLKKLETIKLGSKVGTKDVEGLKKLGIDVGAVYQEIARSTGQSMDQVKAAVKAGTLDADKLVKSIEKVADVKFGPMADELGNSVPGLLNKLSLSFGELFSGMDLGPIKGFLEMLDQALHSKAGGALKKSLQDAFSAIGDVLKKVKLKDVTDGIGMAAAGIERFAGLIRSNSTGLASLVGLTFRFAGALVLVASYAVFFADQMASGVATAIDQVSAFVDAALSMATTVISTIADLPAQALDLGSQIVDGLVEGILSSAARAIAAATSLVDEVIGAARTAAASHSPSQKMMDLGEGGLGEGLVVGMGAANDNASKAGAKLANAAMGGAGTATASGLGAVPSAAGGSQGARGGGGVTVIVQMSGGGAAGVDLAAVEEAARRGAIKGMREVAGEAA